jgi:competence protein ComEA
MSTPSTPTSGATSSAPQPDPAAILARGVNVNTASEADLEALPGIGPALAARIIESRPYSSTADLDRVKGIGPKMLEKIGPYLRF